MRGFRTYPQMGDRGLQSGPDGGKVARTAPALRSPDTDYNRHRTRPIGADLGSTPPGFDGLTRPPIGRLSGRVGGRRYIQLGRHA